MQEHFWLQNMNKIFSVRLGIKNNKYFNTPVFKDLYINIFMKSDKQKIEKYYKLKGAC